MNLHALREYPLQPTFIDHNGEAISMPEGTVVEWHLITPEGQSVVGVIVQDGGPAARLITTAAIGATGTIKMVAVLPEQTHLVGSTDVVLVNFPATAAVSIGIPSEPA